MILLSLSLSLYMSITYDHLKEKKNVSIVHSVNILMKMGAKLQNYKTYIDYIVPGFNEFAKELHFTARDAYIAWRDAGRRRSGDLCSDMRSSRLRFKYTLRICRQNKQAIRANAHAKVLLERDMLSFWKGVKKENNSRLPLSSKVNNCVGEENICKMWQTHSQTLLNSVKTAEHKERVLIELLKRLTLVKLLLLQLIFQMHLNH